MPEHIRQGQTSQAFASTKDNNNINNDVANQVTPKWHNVAPQFWLQQLFQLGQNGIAPEDRLYWMSAMREWRNVNVNLNQDMPAFYNPQWPSQSLEEVTLAMCEVAYQLCDWPLVIQLHQIVECLPRNIATQQREIEVLQLAVAHWQMGQLEQAENLLVSHLHAGDQQGALAGFYQQVSSDLNRMILPPEDRRDGDLLLCPLEEQHLSSFCWVYNDPQIAKLCNLPEFGDDGQWFEWLDGDLANEHKQVFAVMHDQWGFIGSVSIEVRDGAGFFYYWLGQDFQGGGFGPKAVLLMLDLAKQYMGLECCYAKVFDYNLPSQKAMSKMGFRPLPFKVAPPNQDQFYFYRGVEKSDDQLLQELTTLMIYTDSGSKLEMQLQG